MADRKVELVIPDSPTPAQLETIRKYAKETVHINDRSVWAWRCAVCRECVAIIREELGYDEPTAVQLFAAWTVENGGTLYKQGVEEWKRVMELAMPAAKTVADAIKKDTKSEDWKDG